MEVIVEYDDLKNVLRIKTTVYSESNKAYNYAFDLTKGVFTKGNSKELKQAPSYNKRVTEVYLNTKGNGKKEEYSLVYLMNKMSNKAFYKLVQKEGLDNLVRDFKPFKKMGYRFGNGFLANDCEFFVKNHEELYKRSKDFERLYKDNKRLTLQKFLTTKQ